MPPQNVTRFIWQTKVPPRAQFAIWLLALKRLKTGDVLSRLRITTADLAQCPFCGKSKESVNHLFFECEVSWMIWIKVLD